MSTAPRQAALFAALLLFCGNAAAQLTPDRTYFGVSRPLPMKVERPTEATGDAVIELLEYDRPEPVAQAPVEPGWIDMASMFPRFWALPPRVRFAQLRVGDQRIGPPVVLQPMVNPRRAVLFNPQSRQAFFIDPVSRAPNFDARRQGEIAFVDSPKAYSGIRAWVDHHVIFSSTLGDIEFRTRPDHAPNTVWTLLELVRGGFYTDITVHRVVPRLPTGHPFVIQFGDPTGGGDGGPGFYIDLEESALPHDFGVLSMARDDEPDTNGGQVFICLSREGTQRLDGKYTSFAEAVSGLDTIQKMASLEVDARSDRPRKPPVITQARLVPAPPFRTGPEPIKAPTPDGRR
ncbi:MAG: peptidylprolyl isomerase [Phycisphaeraceae bacterium]|nr:peptidylprolyl isomerase [Phycisphaeraceae bacterium]